MSAGAKAVNYVSMVLGGVLGATVGLIIYRRTMARAAELEAEALAALDDQDGDGVYEDSEEGMLVRSGADPDAAALMDDDDISLWEAEGDGGYRDWDEEQGGEGGRKV